MMTSNPRRILTVLGLGILAVASALALPGGDPASGTETSSTPPSKQEPAVRDSWKAVDQLLEEDRAQAALEMVERLQVAARKSGDVKQWTRGLVRRVQLEQALHGFETAVRILRAEPWPDDPMARLGLDLVYAESLVRYLDRNEWEIVDRERVVADDVVDLEKWTVDQIRAEIDRTYGRQWASREVWGARPVTDLPDVLQPSTYPPSVRGTLRDAVSYMWAERLASVARDRGSDTAWSLDREMLLAGPADVDPAGEEPPLVRLAAILGDLERWHAKAGRREAALEAFLERWRRLDAVFVQDDDAAALLAALKSRVDATPQALQWWSMAVAELAEATRGVSEPDALVRARDLARRGEKAHPGTPGGQRCARLAAELEAPRYELGAMSSDAVGRDSLLVTHANIGQLYFRAVRLDPESLINSADDWSWLPSWQQAEKLVRKPDPDLAWSETIPATPDLRDHRTLLTPRIPRTGLWLIAASARADFANEHNAMTAVAMTLGDPVILVGRASERDTNWEVQVRSGATGAALAGAEVSLVRLDWRSGHRVVERQTTDVDGTVRIAAGSWDNMHMVFARAGGEIAVDTQNLSRLWAQDRAADRGALVYTDRAVYRPGQPVLWKIVGWQRDVEAGAIATLPGTTVHVTLRDANSEEVEAVDVKLNEQGSASGRFTAAAGRLLGSWRIETTLGGTTEVRVEEYKRPTFEAKIEEPKEPLRLNREATLTGEARYLFGLPVNEGDVRWRVTREEVRPLWWGWWWWRPEPPEPAEVIAGGTSKLDADGHFTVTFVPRADERLATGSARSGLSWRFRVEADVTDPGGETRNASRSVRLGFVSIETRIEPGGDFLTAGRAASLPALRTDLDGTPRAGSGRWRLVRLEQPATTPLPVDVPRLADVGADAPGGVVTPGDSRRARWEGEHRPEAILAGWSDGAEVTQGTVEHGDKGRAEITLPPLTPGAYRLRYATEDPFGATFELKRELVVAAASAGSGGDGSLHLPLVLGLEAETVEVGGTVRVLVHSGFVGAPLRLELFRLGVRRSVRELVATAAPQWIEVPVTREHRGGFSLRLVGLRDHQLMTLERTVIVPWSDRQLEVRFGSFRDKLRPGTHETWRVEVSDPHGGELETVELLASMADRSLEIVAPYVPPRALDLFPGGQGVGWLRANLGVARRLWQGGHGLVELPEPPSLEPDRVGAIDGYGFGGPGWRSYGVEGGVEGGVMGGVVSGESAMMAPQPSMASPKMMAESPAMDEEADHAMPPPPPPPPIPGQPEEPVELRTDFAETALWEPHLRLAADGSAAIEVDVPDSVTEWGAWVHALTADFRSGSVEARPRTVKELLVRPSLPRFLREGDRLTVEVLVDNTSDKAFDANVKVDLEDAETGKSIAGEFGIAPAVVAGRTVRVEPGRTASVPVELVVPARLGPVAFRAVARAGDLSDGELRPLPVLPGRMHLAQSRFVALRDASARTLRFADLVADDDPTRLDEKLVVTVDAQLLTSVLGALPYLVDYPYECTEQTLNRFLSTGIISSVFKDHPALAAMGKELAAKRDTPLERFDGADPNRRMALEETPWLVESRGGTTGTLDVLRVLDPEVANAQRRDALAKLLATQTSSGGFPWFPGGPPSPWMTLYLVDGFSRALEFGVEVPQEPVVRAWDYLHRWYLDTIIRDAMAKDCCWELTSYLAYVLSSYPDTSWTGDVFDAADRRKMLDFGWKHWRKHSPRLKGLLALALHRGGRQENARTVLESVMDSAKVDPDLGTYWAREESSWLWYNDTVESHAFILRAVAELTPDDPRKDGLVQWLFLDKKLGHWKSTRATAEAIYALTWALRQDGRLAQREVVEVAAGPLRDTFTFEPESSQTRQQLVIPGENVTPAMGTIEVSKATKGFAFASATWHYSTERLPTSSDGDLLRVERHWFRRSTVNKEAVLEPLRDGVALAPGDEVEVQLAITARHAAEYVHLRDPRAAGLEPAALRSGWKWDLGLAWYEEVRDSGTNFFFEWLPAGTYTLKHRLTVRQAGVFRVAPATLQSMYAPEFTATSAGEIVTVAGAKSAVR